MTIRQSECKHHQIARMILKQHAAMAGACLGSHHARHCILTQFGLLDSLYAEGLASRAWQSSQASLEHAYLTQSQSASDLIRLVSCSGASPCFHRDTPHDWGGIGQVVGLSKTAISTSFRNLNEFAF
jgi:hypothetical protein